MNDFPSFEIRFDSLDFFGSFFHQGKNEQVEIWITISVSDFVSIVAKKMQQYRQNQIALHVFNQGFTALATKVTPLWGFGICKLYVFVWKYLYR